MIDVKCKGCNRLLAKADTMNAAIKCPRCKMIFEYHIYSNLVISNLDYLRKTNDSDTIQTETNESEQECSD
jgi:phage FluMu protein Com